MPSLANSPAATSPATSAAAGGHTAQATARSWTAQELAPVPRPPQHHSASTRRCTSPPTPACDAAKSSDSNGPTSTPHGHDLSISRSLQNVGGKPVEFGVKTRTSRRTVELDHHTLDVLVRWRRRLQRDHLPHGADDWMFCNTTRPLPQPRIDHPTLRSHRATKRLPRIRFHDLRHTHASLLVADGVAIKVVSERLGHAHPAFTMHTYQHLLPGMSATAAEQFANLVATAGR